jgi:nucleoside-diphosphate-sugar epimerase
MRVVVTGATGNVGTSVLRSLGADAQVEEIVGVARRAPAATFPKTGWHVADVSRDDLTGILRNADVVIHLAWMIQPSWDERKLEQNNVAGSERVFRAAADAGVRAIVYASSVGAYSPGPKQDRTDESWPTAGIPTSVYSRQKAAVERRLDAVEDEARGIRIVRLRKALVFQRAAGAEIHRYFLGPFVPRALVRPGLLRVIPRWARLRFQAVHSADAGEAYRLAVVGTARGAFNVAAEPVLDSSELARLFAAMRAPLPQSIARAALALTWRLRLQPTDPGWLDMALAAPLMDTSRARRELGWSPRHRADEALLELVGGIRDGAGLPTPPLSPVPSN